MHSLDILLPCGTSILLVVSMKEPTFSVPLIYRLHAGTVMLYEGFGMGGGVEYAFTKADTSFVGIR